MKNIQALRAVKRRFGQVPPHLQDALRYIQHPDDIGILMDDLDRCKTLDELADLVHWLEGRQSGRVDALREAVYTVLGRRDDKQAEEIGDRAWESCSLEELEQLLVLAASTNPMNSPVSLN